MYNVIKTSVYRSIFCFQTDLYLVAANVSCIGIRFPAPHSFYLLTRNTSHGHLFWPFSQDSMTYLWLFYSYLLKYPCFKLNHTALIPCTFTTVIYMDPIEFWRKMKQNIPILKNYLHLNTSFFSTVEKILVQINQSGLKRYLNLFKDLILQFRKFLCWKICLNSKRMPNY